jgi:calcium/calmodulin-dependent protein kinase I
LEEIESMPNAKSNASFQAEEASLDIEALLGRGSSANLYLARRRYVHNGDESGSTHVILKGLREEASEAAQAPSLLKKEADAMAAVQGHPNIVGFHGIFWLEASINDEGIRLPNWAMQLEYCKGGDLHDKVRRTRFEEREAVLVMLAIFRGLSHMHELGYVHRDIKPENVLWAEGDVKIADFGICCHTSNEEEMQRLCGSPGYIAPEIILRQPYGPTADCFSAGALLYFIVSGRLAFSGESPRSTLKKMVSRPLNFRRSRRLECLSDGCKEFMLELTTKDPICRASSQKALESLTLSQGLFSQTSQTSRDMANERFSETSNTSTFGSEDTATSASIEGEKSEAATDKITSLTPRQPTRPECRAMPFRLWLRRK